MNVQRTALPDVFVLEPRVFSDQRGWFMEAFNEAAFQKAVGAQCHFIQDNQSLSRKGVLRGLHYQIGTHPQGKLVRVLCGEVFDVAVDIRADSPTFGHWTGEMLSATNRKQLWVPEGFAHGFLTISEEAEVLYKVTARYDPEGERAIRWDDPDIGIAWPLNGFRPALAEKDAAAPLLSAAEVF